MKPDRVSEIIIKAYDEMELRHKFIKMLFWGLITVGVISMIAGYFGYLPTVHEDINTDKNPGNICVPGSNIYMFQSKGHSESGLYTCNENATGWEFTVPCDENFTEELVDFNGTIAYKLTCNIGARQ